MKTNGWHILILIISMFIFNGCDFSASVREGTLNTFEAGYKKGLECAEMALRGGHPIKYCYEVLDSSMDDLRAENGKN